MNVGKTRGMQLLEVKIDPCSVCGERVGSNSVIYLQCLKWVHCRCSDVPLFSLLFKFVDHLLSKLPQSLSKQMMPWKLLIDFSILEIC